MRMLVIKSENNYSNDTLEAERKRIKNQIEDGGVLLLNGGFDFVGVIPDSEPDAEVVKK